MTSNAGATTPTSRSGTSSQRLRMDRSSTSAPARGASRSSSRATATTSSRWTTTPSCWRCSPSAPRPRACAVETVVADAGDFDLARRDFAIVMAPMQTVQLLGPEGRRGFLRSARAHVMPGGLVAIALVDALETFDDEHVLLPVPDRVVIGGTLYSSQPVALRDNGDTVTIERIREIVRADGQRSASGDILDLDRVALAQVEAEGRAGGPDRASRARHRRDRGARRDERGDAAWLRPRAMRARPRCASARCTPTS